MSAASDEDWPDDLLPDDLAAPPAPAKGKAVPLKRNASQKEAAARAAIARAEAEALAAAQSAVTAQAAQLAQIVNLLIAGHTYGWIGAQIGMTADEVERMVASESARFVRNQPALRTFVRNYISEKYTGLLEAVWDQATDKTHKDLFEAQTAAVRVLERMGRLHGADAPVQKEVQISAAPEAVDALVKQLASGAGFGYDDSIFDTVPGTVVHNAHAQAAAALEVSRNQVEESDGNDEL